MDRGLKIRRGHRCKGKTAAALRQWYGTPLGRALEAAEAARLRQTLASLFGYHLLLVGGHWQEEDPLDESRIRHCVRMGLDAGLDGPDGLFGEAARLPIASDSLDAIVLSHVLEFSEDPHQVLREVDRCLIPEGHLVVLGFNPFGLWGLRRLLVGWRGEVPWCGRFIGPGRLHDWLLLLGFDVLEAVPFLFRPPVGREGMLRRLAGLERLAERRWPLPGAAFLLLARKRVIGMTPIRPRWRPRRSLLSPGVIGSQRMPRSE
ncbi:MAG TPA: SAM-dependent methyltransferase [Thiotrichales bacterium]|nr:SAM-dependent methyltransferase [Thiotrichales bacterium]